MFCFYVHTMYRSNPQVVTPWLKYIVSKNAKCGYFQLFKNSVSYNWTFEFICKTMSFKRIFFRETQPPTETPPGTTLNMEEATTVLFNCFALSQGDNVVLRFIYAVYRNAYGRHILPKNFTKPKKAPKSIADYASNPDTHISRSRRLNNYKDTLKIATREAQIFKIILESPEVLTSLGVNEKFRREIK